MNIVTNGNYSSSRLYRKCMETSQYIELYQHPAASLFQCIFTWLFITVFVIKSYYSLFG